MTRAISPGGQKGEKEAKDEEDKEEERKKEIMKNYSIRKDLGRIFGFCRQEWIWIVPGTIGALLNGAKEPIVAYVLFDAIGKFYLPPDIPVADLWPANGPRPPALDKMYSD